MAQPVSPHSRVKLNMEEKISFFDDDSSSQSMEDEELTPEMVAGTVLVSGGGVSTGVGVDGSSRSDGRGGKDHTGPGTGDGDDHHSDDEEEEHIIAERFVEDEATTASTVTGMVDDTNRTVLASVLHPSCVATHAEEFRTTPEVALLLANHNGGVYEVETVELDGERLNEFDEGTIRCVGGEIVCFPPASSDRRDSKTTVEEGVASSAPLRREPITISVLDVHEFCVLYDDADDDDRPSGIRLYWTPDIGQRTLDLAQSSLAASVSDTLTKRPSKTSMKNLRENTTSELSTEDQQATLSEGAQQQDSGMFNPNNPIGGGSKTEQRTRVVQVFLDPDDAEDLALGLSELFMNLSGQRLAFQQQLRENRVLRIVHFNDVYHLNPTDANATGVIGGASRFHTVLQQLRAQSNILVLFSGDFMGPSLMSVEMKGRQMIDCFNTLGVDYGVFGNHEFDYGLKALKDAVHGYTHGQYVYSGSRTQWIMSNMTEPDGQPLGGAKEYALFHWSGIQVGILGLCENWLPGCSQLEPQEAIYQDVYAKGEQLAKRLKRDGAEIVIALSHCRLNIDKEIKARCPSIDLLLGGHDHFHKNLIPSCGVLKSGEEFQYLSEIEFQFAGMGGDHRVMLKTHPITGNIEPSPMMESMISRYQARLDDRMGKIIGRTNVALDPTEECCRFKEGTLTGFVCDVMATEAGADFAILGGAAFSGKAVMPAGSSITVGNIFGWFPNDTKVMTLKLKGTTVVKMLNVMVKECPEEAPSFPHCSGGLSFTINVITLGKKRKPFVEEVKVGGKPINPIAVYTVALEEFAAEGNAKYKFVPQECVEVVTDLENAGQLVFWVKNFFEEKKGQKNAAVLGEDQGGSGPGSPQQINRRRKSRAYSYYSEGGFSESAARKPTVLGSAQGSLQASQAALSPARPVDFADSKTLGGLGHQPSAYSISADGGGLLGSEVSGSFAKGGGGPEDVPIYKAADFRPTQFLASLNSKLIAQLNNMNQRLSEELDTSALARVVRGAMKSLIGAENAKLFLFDEEAETLRQIGNVGQMVRVVHLNDETLPSLVARDKVVVRISSDGGTASGGGGGANGVSLVDLNELSDTSNSMTFPILHHNQVVAVVQCGKKVADERDEFDFFGEGEEQNFTPDDMGVALLFGRQLATQLHFAILYSRMKRSEAATDALLQVATTLNQLAREQPIHEVSLKVGAFAKEVVGCDRASVFLIDGQEMWSTVPVTDAETGEVRPTTIRIPVGTGVAGQSALKKEIWNVHDAYQCEHFNPEPDRRSGYLTRTILCLPMYNEAGDVIGVLQLINKRDGAVFHSNDEKVAEEFLTVATATLQNCTEIQTLKTGVDAAAVQIMPTHELDRIHIKAGWPTVRLWLKRIIALGRMTAQYNTNRRNDRFTMRNSRAFTTQNFKNFSDWEPNSFVGGAMMGSFRGIPDSSASPNTSQLLSRQSIKKSIVGGGGGNFSAFPQSPKASVAGIDGQPPGPGGRGRPSTWGQGFAGSSTSTGGGGAASGKISFRPVLMNSATFSQGSHSQSGLDVNGGSQWGSDSGGFDSSTASSRFGTGGVGRRGGNTRQSNFGPGSPLGFRAQSSTTLKK